MYTQPLRIFKTCLWNSMCVGTQSCGCSKCLGTQTLWVCLNVGTQNLCIIIGCGNAEKWVLKSGYKIFLGTQTIEYTKMWDPKIVDNENDGYSKKCES